LIDPDHREEKKVVGEASNFHQFCGSMYFLIEAVFFCTGEPGAAARRTSGNRCWRGRCAGLWCLLFWKRNMSNADT
jgi:hypothetical protein